MRARPHGNVTIFEETFTVCLCTINVSSLKWRYEDRKLEQREHELGMNILLILLICLLTLYAPIELTRMIINWNVSGRFLFEIVFMWLFYAIGILITSVVVARRRS